MPEIVGRLRPPRLATAPTSPAGGEEYFDTGLNQLLYWNGTTWIAGAGGGGGLTPVAVSAPYTASANQLVLMTGANAVTLPSAPANGAVVGVEALTATVTVNRGGTDTINYASNAGLTSTPIAVGTALTFTYLTGVWYAAAGSAGAVELNATYTARMNRSAAYTISGATQKMPFDAVAFDPGSHVQIANSRYICPVAGYYQVDYGLTAAPGAPGGVQIYIGVWKNGVQNTQLVRDGYTDQGGWIAFVGTDIMQCNAGDYLEMWYGGATGSWPSAGGFLAVSLVAATAVQQQPLQAASQARAYRNAALSLPANTWTKIPVDTASFDAGQNLVLASNRYVCPVGGYYHVEGMWLGATAVTTSTEALAGIYKNGARVPLGAPSWSPSGATPGQDTGASVSDTIQCNAGDYLELWAMPGATVINLTVGSSAFNYLAVSLVGTQPTAAPANAARAHRAAAFTPTASTWTKIPLDTVAFDPGGNFSVANGRYVCPIAGTYDVLASVVSQVSGTGTYTNYAVGLYKNGAQVSYSNTMASVQNASGLTLADKVQCNAGDYLELWVYNGQGTAVTVGSLETWMSVSLLTAAPAPLPVTVPQVVTAGLPSSPVDGQECYFVADATNGVVWHLKYRAADPSTHKWQFVGGHGVLTTPSGSMTAAITAPTPLTSGPVATVPIAGDYLVCFQCLMRLTVAGSTDLDMALGQNNVAIGLTARGNVGANQEAQSVYSEQRFNGLNAGDVLSVQNWSSASLAVAYGPAWIDMKPIRVG